MKSILEKLNRGARYRATETRLRKLVPQASLISEAIEPYMPQRNLLIEIPGRSGDLLYLVAY